MSLERVGTDSVLARWEDSGVPQAREYSSPDKEKLRAFPEEAHKFSPIDAGILKALDEAAQTAAKDGVRFAVQKLQLRGGSGDIVATDGRQLLIQGNIALPWKEDVLVPALPVFGCRELQDAPVAIGKTDEYVCIRVGLWTFFLSIDAESHFPKVESVIPRATGDSTTCHLSPEDAAFLLKVLPRLPGRQEENAPLTLDLNGQVALRVKGEGSSRITEVILAHSTVTGAPVRIAGNRQLLARAVQLGFTEFRIVKPDVPVVCTDKYRTFLWMPLDRKGVLPPAEDALRIASPGEEISVSSPSKERSRKTMTEPSANGQQHRAPAMEKAVEAGRIAAIGELGIDAGNGLALCNVESGEIFGEVSPLRFVGEEIAEVLQGLFNDMGERDDADHGNASQHKVRHALLYASPYPVPRCLNFAKVQLCVLSYRLLNDFAASRFCVYEDGTRRRKKPAIVRVKCACQGRKP